MRLGAARIRGRVVLTTRATRAAPMRRVARVADAEPPSACPELFN